ncbi:carbohydrate-binding protein [Kitasatospora paracochleata]|uniref:CBM6 domain-containing protein n=1 Tax=Kitasatospora paracochleata TaxID=58354 RepID=A0ABT1IR19_9ACTN|nr:hypothetical protein [Kitasatospora paracochleata]MCP2307061.1 hypothetical protein [Kitasatospora paracochleata]
MTVTTAGSNDAPESGAGDEDPFAYLYRPADGEAAPADRPRSSYNRPMEVGRASYGAPAAPQHPYGRPVAAASDAPTTAVPQQSRYAERSRPQPGEDRPGGGRGKAAVIGAVAVVAAIAVGAGIALSTGDPDGKPSANAGHSSAPAQPSSAAPASPSAPASAAAGTDPVADASKLQAQGATPANAVKGAISADGGYLSLLPGSSVTWTVSVPTAGQYKFWLHFNNTGGDLPAAVSVNGQDREGGVTFKNYSKGNTDPGQAWYNTNIWPQLQAGTNTLTVSVPAGSSGGVLLDQVALTAMSVGTYPGGH